MRYFRAAVHRILSDYGTSATARRARPLAPLVNRAHACFSPLVRFPRAWTSWMSALRVSLRSRADITIHVATHRRSSSSTRETSAKSTDDDRVTLILPRLYGDVASNVAIATIKVPDEAKRAA